MFILCLIHDNLRVEVNKPPYNTINKGYEDIIFIDKYDLEIVFSSK